jgi:hypothetical protein
MMPDAGSLGRDACRVAPSGETQRRFVRSTSALPAACAFALRVQRHGCALFFGFP